MRLTILILAAAYLLGSIPFGYLLVLIFRKQDIRATGSGNIGATNVARTGKGLGIATLVLDAAKAAAAVVLAMHFAPGNRDLAALAAVCAVLGHVFPVWLGFRGGKGVASALGTFLVLCWPAALGALGVFIIVTALTRLVSLASIIGAIALPLFMLWLEPYHSAIFTPAIFFIPLLVIAKHHANIGRLLAGTESKFGSKKQGVSA